MTINTIGLSGINAAGILLNNTAHNIANGETPWFTRRRGVLEAEQSHWAGLLNQLGGVRVLCLERLSDGYLNDQVFGASANQSMANAFLPPLAQLDQLLGGEDTGLSEVLNGCIGDLQRCETRPESIPLRQQWLGSTGQLVDRFRMLSQQLQTASDLRIQLMGNIITEANQIGPVIAGLNQQISELSGLTGGPDDGNCADLMDQRDNLINQLSGLLSVEVDRQDNNSINLLITSSQGVIPLVSGQYYYPLSFSTDMVDPLAPTVVANIPGTTLTVMPRTGTLAGLQQLHSEGLMPIVNQLGLMAVLLASEVNSQLTQGVDPAGAVGVPLFQDVNTTAAMGERVLPVTVTGSGVLSVSIDNLALLTPSEYQLTFTATDQCSVIRLSDGQTFTGTLTTTTPFTIDGLSIALTGTPKTGDQYLLTPWRNAANELAITLTSPSLLAFAATGQGPGDNQNLLALLNCLKGNGTDCPGLVGKNIELQSSVANQTAAAMQQQKTYQNLYLAAMAERDGLSSVNLDEEAANLLRFQQFYQANARVLRASQVVIDELLAAFS